MAAPKHPPFQVYPRALARKLALELDGQESKILSWMFGRVQVKKSKGKVRIPGTKETRQSARGEIVTSYPNIARDTGMSVSTVRRRLAKMERYPWVQVTTSRGFAGMQGGTLIALDLDAIEYWRPTDRSTVPIETGTPDLSRHVTANATDRSTVPISVDVPASVGASELQASAAPDGMTVGVPIPRTGSTATHTASSPLKARPKDSGSAIDGAKRPRTDNGMGSPLGARPPDKATAAARMQARPDRLGLTDEDHQPVDDTLAGSIHVRIRHPTDGQGHGLPPDDDIPF